MTKHQPLKVTHRDMQGNVIDPTRNLTLLAAHLRLLKEGKDPKDYEFTFTDESATSVLSWDRVPGRR